MFALAITLGSALGMLIAMGLLRLIPTKYLEPDLQHKYVTIEESKKWM